MGRIRSVTLRSPFPVLEGDRRLINSDLFCVRVSRVEDEGRRVCVDGRRDSPVCVDGRRESPVCMICKGLRGVHSRGSALFAESPRGILIFHTECNWPQLPRKLDFPVLQRMES